MLATGTFTVATEAQSMSEPFENMALGHRTLAKQFSGDLTGTSRVMMMSAGSPATGSAGYVALERVAGQLAGRGGTFVLQHSGTMNRGASLLSVTVIPDSGTGELAGLSGSMTIDIVEKQHFYTFTYELADAAG